MTDRELEIALRDAAAHVAYPPAVDLAPLVRARIAEPSAGLRQLLWSPRFALVPALATIVVIVIATLAFQPVGARAADLLGIRGLFIIRTSAPLPTLSPRPSPSPGASQPPGGILSDATRVASVEQASVSVGFPVRVPSALGPPDEVYVRVADDAQAFLVYRPRTGTSTTPSIPESSQTGVGLLITEVRGSFQTGFAGKLLGPSSKLEEVTLASGTRAIWIEGAPHQFFYQRPNGTIVNDTLRLAGNVLIWNAGDVLVRLEADVTRDVAVGLANSMR